MDLETTKIGDFYTVRNKTMNILVNSSNTVSQPIATSDYKTNTLMGEGACLYYPDIQGSTAIGCNAVITESNTVQLGSNGLTNTTVGNNLFVNNEVRARKIIITKHVNDEETDVMNYINSLEDRIDALETALQPIIVEREAKEDWELRLKQQLNSRVEEAEKKKS